MVYHQLLKKPPAPKKNRKNKYKHTHTHTKKKKKKNTPCKGNIGTFILCFLGLKQALSGLLWLLRRPLLLARSCQRWALNSFKLVQTLNAKP